MMKNDPTLIYLVVAYVISLAFLNNYMQVISKVLSATIRQLVSTCRVVVVWGVGTETAAVTFVTFDAYFFLSVGNCESLLI